MIQYSRADGEATFGMTDDGPQQLVSKQLMASGTIRFDGRRNLSDIVIDEVTGVPGDPDVLRNREALEHARRAELVRDLLAGSLHDLPTSGASKAMQSALGSPMQSALGSPAVSQFLRDQAGTSGASKAMQAALGSQGLLEGRVGTSGVKPGGASSRPRVERAPSNQSEQAGNVKDGGTDALTEASSSDD